MPHIAKQKLATRYSAWPSEDLLRATMVEPHQYTAEALELMSNELERRNCPLPQRQELLETIARGSAEEDRRFTGIKGLLALMIFVIAGNSIVLLAGAANGAFQGSSSLGPWLLTVAQACQGIFGLVVCTLLVRKSSQAPRHAASWFLLNATVTVAVFLDFSLGSGQIQSGRYPLTTALSCALWLTYLSTSKRVKATYSSKSGHLDLKQA